MRWARPGPFRQSLENELFELLRVVRVLGGSDGKRLGFFPRDFLVKPHGFVVCLIEAEAERKGQVTSKIGTRRREVVEMFLS
jgi:hypothetical protein